MPTAVPPHASTARASTASPDPAVRGAVRAERGGIRGRTLREPAGSGLLGTILMAVAAFGGAAFVPEGSWVGRLPIAATLRESSLGRALATAVLLAGVVLVLRAWLLIGRDIALARRGDRPARHTPADLVRMFWLWSIPLMLAPPLFSRDAWSYAAQGELARLGYDPYAYGPGINQGEFAAAVDPLWMWTPAPYGPLVLTLQAQVLTLTHGDVYLSVLGMRLIVLAGVALIAIFLPRLARAAGGDPSLALWLGLLNPLVAMHFVSGVHNDALMIGLVLAGLALAYQGMVRWGAVVVALAMAVKAPALIALGFVGVVWASRLDGRLRRLRGCALAAGVGGAAFLVVTILTRFGFGWVAALDTPGTVRTWLSLPTAFGMATGRLTEIVGWGDYTDGLITAARLVCLLLAGALTATLLLRPGRIDALRGAGACLLAVVALGPVVHPWYLLWGIVLLAAARLAERERLALAWGSVAFTVYGLVNGSTFVGPLAAAGTLAALTAAGALLARLVTAERRTGGGILVPAAAALPRLPAGPVEDASDWPARSAAALPAARREDGVRR